MIAGQGGKEERYESLTLPFSSPCIVLYTDEVLIYKLQDISKAATDSSPADSAKTISTVTLNARAQWVR